MIVGETKLDDSYPMSQFLIERFAEPFRLDRDKNGGGILVYVRDFIPCKKLRKHAFPHDIEDPVQIKRTFHNLSKNGDL